MVFSSLNPPIRQWRGQRVWIIGASTGIGHALAHALAQRGAQVALSARQADALNSLAQELKDKYQATTLSLPLDVTDHLALVQRSAELWTAWREIDLVVLMAGTYVEMRAQSFERDKAVQQIQVNLVGTLNCLAAILKPLLAQKHGHISIVASVAGYRGLPNAIVYGPTKAALINLGESLYADLHADGLGVSVIEPGFVDTPLTRKNTFPMPCLISAEQAAQEIIRGWEKGHFEIHFPKRFTQALRFLRMLPASLYFKLVARFTGI